MTRFSGQYKYCSVEGRKIDQGGRKTFLILRSLIKSSVASTVIFTGSTHNPHLHIHTCCLWPLQSIGGNTTSLKRVLLSISYKEAAHTTVLEILWSSTLTSASAGLEPLQLADIDGHPTSQYSSPLCCYWQWSILGGNCGHRQGWERDKNGAVGSELQFKRCRIIC